MTRISQLVVAFALSGLLLVVGAASAPAEETTTPPALTLENLELAPIQEAEWAVIAREHPELVVRIKLLGQRAGRVYENLQARVRKDDAGAAKLQAELGRIAGKLQPDLDRLGRVIRSLGITPDVLEALRETPRGPRRVERHALRLVPRAPDLPPRTRALHERLAPAVEGALFTLDGVRARLPEDADVAAHLETAERDLLTRYWRVVDATLDLDQRAWLRRRLPTSLAKTGNLLGHVFLLSGLETSQALRLRSLLVRLEAEAAPDQAAVKRADVALADENLDAGARGRQSRQKHEAERRNLERFVDAWQEGLALLTPTQRRELEALPPLLTAQERVGDLKVDLEGIDLLPGQAEALARLARRYGPVKGRLVQRLVGIEAMGQDHGPDSPQREAMQILQARAYADALAEGRRAVHEVFSDLLSEDQIVGWVLGRGRD